jgi:2,3-bisphosphoglycerate-independent phosphoglycerate mutase/Metalloenzyme superfamily
MDIQELVSTLHTDNGSKIVLIVADGLGGLPLKPGGQTELETAATPNLDNVVAENVCGLSLPILPGITSGSGPGHLGIFGYDPLQTIIGRGVLEHRSRNGKDEIDRPSQRWLAQEKSPGKAGRRRCNHHIGNHQSSYPSKKS